MEGCIIRKARKQPKRFAFFFYPIIQLLPTQTNYNNHLQTLFFKGEICDYLCIVKWRMLTDQMTAHERPGEQGEKRNGN